MKVGLKAESHSSSELLGALFRGATKKGIVMGSRQLLFGDYVVSLTAPGAARMPNGVECGVQVAPAAKVGIGRGRLTLGHLEIAPGPPWDPVPRFPDLESLPAGPVPAGIQMGSWLPSAGLGYHALIAGYVAGLVLLHGQWRRAEQVAASVSASAGPLGATVLRHAARGEVPEPVHVLLATGDLGRMVASSPTGTAWLRGLVSAGLPLDAAATVVAGRR